LLTAIAVNKCINWCFVYVHICCRVVRLRDVTSRDFSAPYRPVWLGLKRWPFTYVGVAGNKHYMIPCGRWRSVAMRWVYHRELYTTSISFTFKMWRENDEHGRLKHRLWHSSIFVVHSGFHGHGFGLGFVSVSAWRSRAHSCWFCLTWSYQVGLIGLSTTVGH